MKKLWLVLMACLLAGMAYAQLETDVLPPEWRGDPNTTVQAWSFDESANPALIEAGYSFNPHGTPVATVSTNENVGGLPLQTYWMETEGGRDGVWRIYGSDYLSLHIPNTELDNPFKEIWLQLTWSAANIDRAPLFQTDPAYSTIELIQAAAVADSEYYRSVYKIVLEPNPVEEWIWVQPRDCTLYIDEIVVDTRCIPEPSSVALIGVGGILGLFIRRRFPSAQRDESVDCLLTRSHMRR
jgi:hypothetical protein